MNRKTTRIFAVLLCLVMALSLFTGCQGSLAKEAEKITRGYYGLRIAGGPVDSEEAAIANALASVLKEGGYGATVLITDDARDNITKVKEYKADLAIVSSKALSASQESDELVMLMALGASTDASRNIILCSDDTMDAMAWDMLSLIAEGLDALSAASDGVEIKMADGNTERPVALQAGAEKFFKKQPWK